MNKIILLSLALIICASTITPARAELNIRIPTPVQVGALITAGTLTGAFSVLAGHFAYHMMQEEPNNGGRPDKLFHGIVTIGSGVAAVTSGIICYQAFKNAIQLLK